MTTPAPLARKRAVRAKDGPTAASRVVLGPKAHVGSVGPSTVAPERLADQPIRRSKRFQRVVYGAVGDPRDKVLMARALDKGVKHTRAFGSRDKFARGVMAIVALAGDDVKRMIAEDDEMKGWFWEALRNGVRLGDSTCVRLYSDILKLVDAEKQVVVMVLQQLGMSSMDELQALVESGKDHENVSAEHRFAIVMDFAEKYVDANPGSREGAVHRLGGVMVRRSDSMAEVVRDG